MSDRKFPISYSRVNTFQTCPLQFEYLYVNRSVQVVESEQMLYGTRVHEQLEKYGKTRDENQLTTESRKWKGLVDSILRQKGDIHWEYQMSITQDLEPCGWFDEEVWLRGIADVLVINGDTAYVLDWKTGKVRDNPQQLQLFACMVMLLFPEVQTVRTAFVWLVHDVITDVIYKRSMFDVMWKNLMTQFDQVEEAVRLGVFEPKPSRLCNWCSAKDVCSYA